MKLGRMDDVMRVGFVNVFLVVIKYSFCDVCGWSSWKVMLLLGWVVFDILEEYLCLCDLVGEVVVM